jgi:mono/diheme cytochrome c family protein
MCFPIFKARHFECTIKRSRILEAVMSNSYLLLLVAAALAACATKTVDQAPYDPLQEYEEVESATILDAPEPVPGAFAPEHLYLVERGEYLVELLGCGACHTDGALEGVPDFDKALAGSSVGIAFSNPLGEANPGIIFPPNLTPDEETGIGLWSDRQIENAIRVGVGRHSGRRIAVMPWQGYTKMTPEDVLAIMSYLRSIPAIHHQVPNEVVAGESSDDPFVYFGVYRSRNEE